MVRRPDEFTHRFAQVNGGLRMHYVTEGNPGGTPLVLCHGFPDYWYGWRHQIGPLAEAGYYVIVPDLRGFGQTDAPTDPNQYGFKTLVEDVTGLLNVLKIPRAIFLGHDWGGALVWRIALFAPERVLAVGALCTAFTPRTETFRTLEEIVERIPAFAYQLFLVQPDTPRLLLNNVDRFFRLIMRSSRKEDHVGSPFDMKENGRGELELADAPRSALLSQMELDAYVATYRARGFEGGLNWYKNRRVTWEQEAGLTMRIPHDALMLTAGRDPVLRPELTAKMEENVPNLTRVNIQEAAHWVQVEQPTAVNRSILTWLHSLPIQSKL